MSEAIQFYQGGGGVLRISHLVDGVPIGGITAAKYQLFDRAGAALLAKTLGAGITFESGRVVIVFTPGDFELLAGAFTHECIVRDLQNRPLFILTGPIRLIPTKVRLV